MPDQKHSLLILWLLAAGLVVVMAVAWSTSISKVLHLFVTNKNSYVVTTAALTHNTCKKYGNEATFDINFNGETLQGRDGCLLFADEGDVVKVYFNKTDLYDNGIVNELIRLCIGQCLFFIALASCFFYKLNNHQKTRKITS